MKETLRLWLFALLFGLIATLVGGCWTGRAISAPSDDVVFVMITKVSNPHSRVLRCDRSGCVRVYDTRSSNR